MEITYAIVYTITSILCFLAIGFTFYRPKQISKIIWFTTAYIIARLTFRIFDFENSRQHYEELEVWNFGMMLQTYAILMGLIFLVNFFEADLFRNVIASLLVVLAGFSVILIFNSSEDIKWLVIFKKDFGVMLMFVLIMAYILRVLQQLNNISIKNF